MKIVKTIGLAVFAALALMASLGAGSALGAETTLCKTATASPNCKSGDNYAAGTAIQADLTGTLYISSNLLDVKCDESHLEAKTGAAAGNPMPVELSSWTLGKCGSNAKQNNCTVTNPEVDEEGSLLWSAGSNGTLSAGASWHFKCIVGGITKFDCTLGLKTSADLNGGSSPQLVLPEPGIGAVSGALCPAAALLWEGATFNVTSPKPGYVAKIPDPGTQLCKANEKPCSTGNTYPAGTLLKAQSTNFKFTTNVYDLSCNEASVTFETQAATADPLPVKVVSSSFGQCKYGSGGYNCSAVTGSYGASTIAWTAGTHGVLKTPKTSWNFSCGINGIYKWTFTMQEGWETLFESTNETEEHPVAGFQYIEMPVNCKGVCAESASLSADFRFASPTPLYLTHQD